MAAEQNLTKRKEGVIIMEKIIRTQNVLKNIGITISGVVIILMMFFITFDVALRNLFDYSIPGGYNYVEKYFMPFIVFPALAYVYSSGVLPRLDLLVDKFSNGKQLAINLIMRVIDLVIFGLMFYYSFKYMIANTAQGTAFSVGGSLAPLAPSLIIAVIGFLLLVVEIILAFYKNINSSYQVKETQNLNEGI